jgi:hypothetical protein
MPTFHVDSTNGNDLLGDGSFQAPFKTLEHIFGLDNTPGYTLLDSTTVYLLAGTFVVEQSLVKSGVDNLIIRNFPNANVTITQNFDGAPLFDLTEMPRFTLNGVKIQSTKNCSEIFKLTNCNLSTIAATTLDDLTFSATGADFAVVRMINTSTTLDTCTINNLTVPGNITVVAVDNASLATVKASKITNITGGSSSTVSAIRVAPNNINVTVDDVEINHLYGGDTYGVIADFAGTNTPMLLDRLKVKNCEFGVYLKNNPETHKSSVRGRRIEFVGTNYACVADAASFSIYNCVFTKSTFGLLAKQSSHVEAYNNIFANIKDFNNFGNTYAIRAQDSSEVNVSYCDFYGNTTIYQEASNGSIIKGEYIRFTNPKFTDEANEDFSLLDTSPLVDVGRPVDYTIVGAAADIGKYDVDRLVPNDEIALLAAKIVTRTYRAYDLGQIDVQALVGQIMQQIDPNMIPREGTAINDLMVKPHGILYQRILNSIMLIARNQSILNAAQMASQELDAFAQNHYIVRQAGTLAYTTVRIYFKDPVSLVVTPQDIFTSQDGLRFYARNYTAISSGEMAGNIEGSLYFVDIPIEAENFGSTYNVTSGAITTWVGAPTAALNVVNLTDAFPGQDEEANEDLIQRIQFSIGMRSLVHKTGIGAILAESFPEVQRTVAIGAGDPEMSRDIFYNVHFYGKTDIYISGTELALAKYDIINAQASTLINRTTIGDVPIIDLIELRVIDPISHEPTDLVIPTNKYALNVANNKVDERYSIYEEMTLTLDNDYVGSDVRMTFKWAPEIIQVHNFCLSDNNRVLCEDIRVKHMVPVFLSMQINYKSVIELDEAAIITAIKSFINTFLPEDEFQVSDIIDIMYRYAADFVEQPLTVEARYLHQNGNNETRYFENTNTIPRIYGYLADNITLNRLA